MGDAIDPFSAPRPTSQGVLPQGQVPSSLPLGSQEPHSPPWATPGHPDAPEYAAPYGLPPAYPGAPQYADRYRRPPVNPDAQQYSTPHAAHDESPYAAPYAAYAPPAWKRSWRTTMGRWGIGVGVAFITSFLLGMAAGHGQATPEAGGQVAGALASGTWMYVLLVPWWLDHVVARLGKAETWAIHGGVSLILALVNFGYLSVVARTTDSGLNVGAEAWMVLVMWAVAFGLGMLLADRLPKSYRPTSYQPQAA